MSHEAKVSASRRLWTRRCVWPCGCALPRAVSWMARRFASRSARTQMSVLHFSNKEQLIFVTGAWRGCLQCGPRRNPGSRALLPCGEDALDCCAGALSPPQCRPAHLCGASRLLDRHARRQAQDGAVAEGGPPGHRVRLRAHLLPAAPAARLQGEAALRARDGRRWPASPASRLPAEAAVALGVLAGCAQEDEMGGEPRLAATGALRSCNPDRVILKKIVLTGAHATAGGASAMRAAPRRTGGEPREPWPPDVASRCRADGDARAQGTPCACTRSAAPFASCSTTPTMCAGSGPWSSTRAAGGAGASPSRSVR